MTTNGVVTQAWIVILPLQVRRANYSDNPSIILYSKTGFTSEVHKNLIGYNVILSKLYQPKANAINLIVKFPGSCWNGLFPLKVIVNWSDVVVKT